MRFLPLKDLTAHTASRREQAPFNTRWIECPVLQSQLLLALPQAQQIWDLEGKVIAGELKQEVTSTSGKQSTVTPAALYDDG